MPLLNQQIIQMLAVRDVITDLKYINKSCEISRNEQPNEYRGKAAKEENNLTLRGREGRH